MEIRERKGGEQTYEKEQEKASFGSWQMAFFNWFVVTTWDAELLSRLYWIFSRDLRRR